MKKVNSSIFSDVLPEDYLNFSNGLIIKNISGLIKSLKVMSDEEFKHHVSRSRNEIGEWITDCYNNKKLGRKINKTKKKVKIIKLLEKALISEEKVMVKQKKKELKKIILPKSKRGIIQSLKKVDDHLGGNF